MAFPNNNLTGNFQAVTKIKLETLYSQLMEMVIQILKES